MTALSDRLELALAALALLGIIVGWLRVIKPRVGKLVDVWTALVELLFGKPAEPDNPITGAPGVPAIPGIGPRLGEQERLTAVLVENVALLTQQQGQLIGISETLMDHGHRLTILEEQTLERVVTKAESASAWRAVEAVANATPPAAPEIDT